MAKRRRVLSHAVALALGGSLVDIASGARNRSRARGSRPTRSEDRTILSMAGKPSVLGKAGVPEVAVSHLETVRRFGSASMADVDRVSGTVLIAGTGVSAGSGTAWGSFDASSVAKELESETGFARIDGPRKPTGDGESTGAVFARSDPTLGLSVASGRIDVAHDGSREEARKRLAGRRQQSASTLSEERRSTGLPSVLGGDLAVYVSLSEPTRARILDELPGSAGKIERIVRDAQSAGVAIGVAPETTTIRYAISLREDHQADHAVSEVKRDVASHEATRLLDEDASDTTVVVDVLTRTDAIWALQKDTFSAE